MKQVCLLSLFVTGVFVCTAQNIVPINQFAATTLSEIRVPAMDKGLWVSYYFNGSPCDSGRLVRNMPDGLWKSWYPNGQLRVEMHCNAKKLSAAKEEMERIYKPGYYPSPNLREMRQLVVTAPYPYDKLMYRQLYIATHPQGMTGGKLAECMVHGVYKSWLENGILKDSGYCDNGIREGVWEEWDESANLKGVGFYKNGLRYKDWRYYDKEGKLKLIIWYNRQEEITETIVLK